MMNQEIGRLKQEHNVKLSGNEFFQVLLEIHRLRLQTLASEDSDALPWMYSMIHDEG